MSDNPERYLFDDVTAASVKDGDMITVRVTGFALFAPRVEIEVQGGLTREQAIGMLKAAIECCEESPLFDMNPNRATKPVKRA